jgi:hypothetical protein
MDSVKPRERALSTNCLFPAIFLLLLWNAGGCAPKRVAGSGAVIATAPATGYEPAASGGDISGEGSPAGAADDTAPGFNPQLPEPRVLGRAGVFDVAPDRKRPSRPPTGPEGSRLGFEAAALAKKQLGKQYQWGAAGPDKFDCSGLVMFVYNNLGVQLPRVSSRQASAGVHVERKDLRPGDLVFFVLSGSRINHVGIYVGGGKFVHAPRRYSPVRTDSLNDSWWRRRYRGARRIQ